LNLRRNRHAVCGKHAPIPREHRNPQEQRPGEDQDQRGEVHRDGGGELRLQVRYGLCDGWVLIPLCFEHPLKVLSYPKINFEYPHFFIPISWSSPNINRFNNILTTAR